MGLAIAAVEETGSATTRNGPISYHTKHTISRRRGGQEPVWMNQCISGYSVKAAVVAALDRLASGQLHRAADRIAFLGKDRSFSMSSMNIKSQPDCAKVQGIVCPFAQSKLTVGSDESHRRSKGEMSINPSCSLFHGCQLPFQPPWLSIRVSVTQSNMQIACNMH